MMELVVKDIAYKIKAKTILKNIDLSFNSGFYAILGLNAAGKTSLLKIISTLNKPTKGNIYFNGLSIINHPNHLRKHLSFLPQRIGLIPDFTVRQNLMYFSLLKGCTVKSVKIVTRQLLEHFNLLDVENIKVHNLSGGLKQRVAIVLALTNKPKVLILDEPLNNLDNYEREKLYFFLKLYAKDNMVILSTHLIEEIESFCDKVIFMKEGQVTFFGKIEDSIESVQYNIGIVKLNTEDIALNDLAKKYNIISFVKNKNSLEIRYFTKKKDKAKSISAEFKDAFVYYTKYI